MLLVGYFIIKFSLIFWRKMTNLTIMNFPVKATCKLNISNFLIIIRIFDLFEGVLQLKLAAQPASRCIEFVCFFKPVTYHYIFLVSSLHRLKIQQVDHLIIKLGFISKNLMLILSNEILRDYIQLIIFTI